MCQCEAQNLYRAFIWIECSSEGLSSFRAVLVVRLKCANAFANGDGCKVLKDRGEYECEKCKVRQRRS